MADAEQERGEGASDRRRMLRLLDPAKQAPIFLTTAADHLAEEPNILAGALAVSVQNRAKSNSAMMKPYRSRIINRLMCSMWSMAAT